MRRVLGVLVLALAVWWAPRLAWADAQSQLDLATTRYENGKYAEAVDILSKLLAVKVDPSTEEGKERRAVYLRARPIYVACLIGLDRSAEARDIALAQYRDNPFFEPPVGQLPEPVIDLFIEVEADHRDEIEELRTNVVADKQERARLQATRAKARAERIRILERMAAEEKAVTRRSRWIAMVPFGVGQYQNDSFGLGVFFSASEAIALAGTIASTAVAFDAKSTRCPDLQIDDAGKAVEVDCAELASRFDAAQVVNWVSFGSFAALAVAGIIEAQASFAGDTVDVKKRALPPPVEPEVVVTDTGFFLGLRGRF